MTRESDRLRKLDMLADALGFLSLLSLVLHFGFPDVVLPTVLSLLLPAVLPTALFLESLSRLLVVRDPWDYLKRNPIRYLILAMILLELSGIAFWRENARGSMPVASLAGELYLAVFMFTSIGSWLRALILANRWLSNLRIPVLLLPPLTFAAVILFGACLLSLPGMRLVDLPFLDFLFTAVSAVCVTGLTTLDASQAFTPVGKLVLLGLIQIGGLGTLTILALLAFWSSGRLSIGERAAFGELLGGQQFEQTRSIASRIFFVTAAVEIMGAALLWIGFRGKLDHPLPHAVFHSVSAFCNAGFCLLPGGLASFASDPLTVGTLAALIVAGGLGFGTLSELGASAIAPLSPWSGRRALSLSTKCAVGAASVLIAAGTLAFMADAYVSGRPLNIAAALFQSITLRTAGFQLESQLVFGPIGTAVCLLFMIIGASPQSTAGGLKTTTLLRLFTRIDEAERVRTDRVIISLQSFRIAALFLLVYTTIGIAAALLIRRFDRIYFLDAVFESFSALGTVGLSRDLTATLSPGSKGLVICLMFTGRVLFSSFVMAIVRRKRPKSGDVDWA